MIIEYHIKNKNKQVCLTWFTFQFCIFFTSGLAHLLEHTIFHASELFPTEGFSQFLRFERKHQTRLRSWRWRIIFLIYGSMRGGSSNAFTASTYTNFHFDVPKEHFLDALDRWNTNSGWSQSLHALFGCHHILQHLKNNVLDKLYCSPNLSSFSWTENIQTRPLSKKTFFFDKIVIFEIDIFRFVSFFICPVFHEKTVESEVSGGRS